MENCCSGAVGLTGTSVGAVEGCGAWLGFSVVEGLVVIGMGTVVGLVVVGLAVVGLAVGGIAVVGLAVVGWGLGAVGLGSGGTISVGATPENTFMAEDKNNFRLVHS